MTSLVETHPDVYHADIFFNNGPFLIDRAERILVHVPKKPTQWWLWLDDMGALRHPNYCSFPFGYLEQNRVKWFDVNETDVHVQDRGFYVKSNFQHQPPKAKRRR